MGNRTRGRRQDRVVRDRSHMTANQPMVDVQILGLPVDVQRRAAEHVDALRREFELIRLSDGTASLPARLLALIDELEGKFDDFTVEPRTRLANAESNQVLDLDYRLPADVVEAARDLSSLLDEADAFCRAGGHLVTLESSEEAKQFRTWFLMEFIRQGDGEQPRSWPEYLAAHGAD